MRFFKNKKGVFAKKDHLFDVARQFLSLPVSSKMELTGEQRAPEPEKMMCSKFLRDKMFV